MQIWTNQIGGLQFPKCWEWDQHVLCFTIYYLYTRTVFIFFIDLRYDCSSCMIYLSLVFRLFSVTYICLSGDLCPSLSTFSRKTKQRCLIHKLQPHLKSQKKITVLMYKQQMRKHRMYWSHSQLLIFYSLNSNDHHGISASLGSDNKYINILLEDNLRISYKMFRLSPNLLPVITT